MVGYAFQIEMKFKVWLHGFKIKEGSIIFTDRQKDSSKISAVLLAKKYLVSIK